MCVLSICGCKYQVITLMSVTVWLTGPLSYTGFAIEKIGQRRFRTGLSYYICRAMYIVHIVHACVFVYIYIYVYIHVHVCT